MIKVLISGLAIFLAFISFIVANPKLPVIYDENSEKMNAAHIVKDHIRALKVGDTNAI